MVIFGLLMIVGIIANWGRVSGEVAESSGLMSSKPQQEQVIQNTADEDIDN